MKLTFPTVLVMLAILLSGGLSTVQPVAAQEDDYFAIRKNFTIFGRLYEELAGTYVDQIEAEQLMRTGIEAMLSTLDPYTVFIDEADNEDINIISRGRYGGVGLGVDNRGGQLMVAVVFEGYSGEEQGVRAGDVIISIDGQRADELAAIDARNLLRGAPETTVAIEIRREGEPGTLSFVLTRSQIQLNNVTYTGWIGEESDGIGYVRLERFTQEAGREIREAVEAMKSENQLKGFVLDLRGNPGGLLEAAVDVSSMFLPQNVEVVSMRGRAANTDRAFHTRGAPLAENVPLVILVDGVSASAAEIVAGAIQDHDRGVILGESTFGKGLVQIVRELPYNTSVKITTAKYYTPSGRLIQAINYGRDAFGGTAERVPDSLRTAFQTSSGRTVYDGHGIEPDVPVSLGEYSELEDALTRNAAFFLFANHFAAEHPELPSGFVVDDHILNDFQEFLDEEDFSYQTRAERMIDELEADLEDADYESALLDLQDLRNEIKDEKELDFERHAPRLRERLRQEILARYVGQSDQIRASLDTDPQLARAVEILKNDSEYRAILSPR